jgi:hypothetical protein
MTDREAILRLSVNTGDGPAKTSLHYNNAEVIRAIITRHFRVGAGRRQGGKCSYTAYDRPCSLLRASRRPGPMACEMCDCGMRTHPEKLLDAAFVVLSCHEAGHGKANLDYARTSVNIHGT